jgi:ABC-type sugar transport system ATPase subunit
VLCFELMHPHGSYEGDIAIDGEAIRCRSVAEVEAAGIAFLAQEVNVAADLTVAERLALNNEPRRFGLIDAPLRMARARTALAEFELDIEPAMRLGDLASQRLVLIVRALLGDLSAEIYRQLNLLMIQYFCRMMEVRGEPSSNWSGSLRIYGRPTCHLLA